MGATGPIASERLRQAEALHRAVAGLAETERAVLLAAADPEVRRMVEGRLAGEPTVAESPDSAANRFVEAGSIQPGCTIGPYKIEGLLGTGGMGRVFHATDTRLNRRVAIKISDERFSHRFRHEAQSIAALNHPNICTLYDVGANYLVMELVEGETLSARLKRGRISTDKALLYAGQIADALAAAHAKGITHRDVKPGNLMITKNGVKVLDFGLAKMGDGGEQLTESHVLMGTPLYMAPEQLEGKPCDGRTDLYALGLVLYECLGGKPLLPGQVPKWGGITDRLRHVLGRCLEEDPDNRWQTARDLRLELKSAGEAAEAPGLSRQGRRTMLSWAAATAVVLGSIAGAYWFVQRHSFASEDSQSREEAAVSPVLHLTMNLGPGFGGSDEPFLAVSPDGARIVVRLPGQQREVLATRALDQDTINPLAGTEGGRFPFFSPDGKWIVFAAGGKLRKIPSVGGKVATICATSEFLGGWWGEDGRILSAMGGSQSAIYGIDASETPKLLVSAAGANVRLSFPQMLPGRKALVYTSTVNPRSYEDASIEAFSLKTGQRKTILRPGYFGRYLPSGHLVWVRNGSLFGAAFDTERLEIAGPMIPLIEDEIGASPIVGTGNFDFSRNGLFIYIPLRPPGHTVQWIDAKGNAQVLLSDPAVYRDVTFSPDGKRLALTIGAGERQVYTFDMERRLLSRLTLSKQSDIRYPVWSSDGGHIAYISNAKEDRSIWWMRSDGVGQPSTLHQSERAVNRFYFSPDNRTIVIEPLGEPQTWIAHMDLSDTEHPRIVQPEPFIRHTRSGFSVAFSPDGRWLLYSLDEPDEAGLFVRPADWHAPGKWQLTAQGDKYPVWSRTAKEIFYQDPGHHIQVIDYAVNGDVFVPGRPRRWLEQKFDIGSRFFDLAPDGKHVVAVVPVQENSNLTAVVKVNFFDEVKRRARTGN